MWITPSFMISASDSFGLRGGKMSLRVVLAKENVGIGAWFDDPKRTCYTRSVLLGL